MAHTTETHEIYWEAQRIAMCADHALTQALVACYGCNSSIMRYAPIEKLPENIRQLRLAKYAADETVRMALKNMRAEGKTISGFPSVYC